ncbi:MULTISPECIES: copper homeostasis protein CutC [unclassified Sphingomonas]|uniref:copper homeostasis protein CutC n=1 Tax=unclassified Sphingomonas TaxID=196159 RepID=UPI0006F693B6|nr:MULTISPECIES: copper homeostasis protein CutC [unclassified Sphingomonas]KQM61931.1 copper homeostasis protein CutC [Sphingomonas sp. Leaf16]KQN13204.1 copper homeostasis protein CutC [Sphingomonas sp. Leaf29]KQN20089.1 copper homeostasis protein CutC [Sphingomonas sp. Leaf32]
MPRTTLEICIDSVAGADAAIAGGADRIELCGALSVGGLTPSAGLAGEVLHLAQAAGVRVHAMVRPRAGDFAYDADEVDTAISEGKTLILAGADGLVFGAARDGSLDHDVLARWVRAMRAARADIDLTLHRAVDLLVDPVAAVEPAVALGFDRILTSGGATRAVDGAEVIAAMQAQAAGRIMVMPGAGIRPDNVAALRARTGASEVHASASVPIVQDDRRVIALGFAGPGLARTDRAVVRALRDAVDA